MRIEYETELYHHGIRGQKWGVRRFQPYSYTGPRKGGKLGKEIGMAGKKAGKAIASVGRKVGGAVKAKIAQAKVNARAKKVEKMTATKGSFQKNYNKLTQEERDAAMKRFTDMQKLSDMKADDLKRYANYAKSTFDIIHNVKGAADDVSTMLTGKDIGENMKKESKLKEGTKDWADYQRTMADADVKLATARKLDMEADAKSAEAAKNKQEAWLTERDNKKEREKIVKDEKAAEDKAKKEAFDKTLRGRAVNAGKEAAKNAATAAKEGAKDLAKDAASAGKESARFVKGAYGDAAKGAMEAISNAVNQTRTNRNTDLKTAAASFDYETWDWRKKRPLKHARSRGAVVGAERINIRYETELYHHGIRGQKWGLRRFQNADGSLTSKGKARYSSPKFKSSESSEPNHTGAGGGGGGVDDELAQLEAKLAELTPGTPEYKDLSNQIEILKRSKTESAYNIPLYDPNDQSATGKIKYTADKLKYEEMKRKEDLKAIGETLLNKTPKNISDDVNMALYKAPIIGDKYRRAKGNQKIDDLGHQFFGDFGDGKQKQKHASIPEGRKKKVTSGSTSPSKRRKSGASQVGDGMPSTTLKKRPIGRKKKVLSGGTTIRKRRRSGASQVGNGMPSNIRRH